MEKPGVPTELFSFKTWESDDVSEEHKIANGFANPLRGHASPQKKDFPF